MTNYFAENLKYLRNKKGLSQNRLAELANVNQASINRWEAKEMSPSLDNVNDLANALGVTVGSLLGEKLFEDKFDEFEILFDKYKEVLTESDKEHIKFIIEQRQKEIDRELGEE